MTDRKREMLDLLEAYKVVFASPHGQIVLKDLEIHCHVNKTTFVAGDSDVTFFNEGKRAVALSIKRKLAAASSGEVLERIKNMDANTEEDDYE